MVELEKKYKIGVRHFGLINYIGLFALGPESLQLLVILGILSALFIGLLRPIKGLVNFIRRS